MTRTSAPPCFQLLGRDIASVADAFIEHDVKFTFGEGAETLFFDLDTGACFRRSCRLR